MRDMWRSRDKPTPLDFDAIVEGSFVVKEPTKHAASSSNTKGQVNGHANGASWSNGSGGLKDQRALTTSPFSYQGIHLSETMYG